MPTPFMHMALAERLIHDRDFSPARRDILNASWSAFLLGCVAPDARVSSGLSRVSTHFFEYEPIINPSAITAMLNAYPALSYRTISDRDQAAFVAGYIGHLMMDEVWCVEMLFPHFYTEWGTPRERHLMLHMLLGTLDERDVRSLPQSHYSALCAATPHHWLPFMTDLDLAGWRDLIAEQLAPNGKNLTFSILGKRIDMTPDQMGAFIHDPHQMNRLWSNVPQKTVTEIEEKMYSAVRNAIAQYLT